MDTHVRTLGILHIVFGAIGVLIGLAIFLFFGGIAGMVGLAGNADESILAVPIIGTIGLLVLVILMALSLPGIIAGAGLLSYRPWARMLMIVLSALHLFNFPFGTALGVYGLWVLLSPDVTTMFQRQEQFPEPL